MNVITIFVLTFMGHTGIPLKAYADMAVDEIHTLSPIEAWIRATLGDVQFAGWSSVTGQTLA